MMEEASWLQEHCYDADGESNRGSANSSIGSSGGLRSFDVEGSGGGNAGEPSPPQRVVKVSVLARLLYLGGV